MDDLAKPGPPRITSWQQSPRELWEQKLVPPVATFATGWQTALQRPPPVRLMSVGWEVSVPATVSVPIDPARVRTMGIQFATGCEALVSKPASTVVASKPPSAGRSKSNRRRWRPRADSATRLRPPQDIVKLEDRLYYLLQPPLESLLASQSLHFPLVPFPFQY
ncbi:MAG: hypothetical protein ABGX05_03765, partial [Pirellulaceae bacterium]